MIIEQRPFLAAPAALSSFPPILQRIYAARGVTEEAQLDKSLQTLLPFEALSDVEKACQRLAEALFRQENMLVIGDFDADGATSSALAVSALRQMGARHVHYLVPNRFEFGYGLTPALVHYAQSLSPQLLITVDNGIASLEGVEAAIKAGMEVIITDHHLPGEHLPKAHAIVNPNQAHDNFASKSIAGVGVIFYVMVALRRYLANQKWFLQQNIPEPNMAQFLDLVALGTVADVVALDQNNRIMVNQGLARMRKGLCRPGIKALVEISGRELSRLRESDLGFAIGPRLNAAGRLDDMSLGIECLLTEDEHKARVLATELDALNKERREIEADMKAQALQSIQKLISQLDQGSRLPAALCLSDKHWHQGVIGILAGRLKERYHRPTIIFAQVSEEELKGSARSVSGLNIRDVLAAIDVAHPGLIKKFGGHAMAAGLSLAPAHFSKFQAALIQEVEKQLDPSQYVGKLLTDGSLAPLDFTLKTAVLLQEAGPWGQQFPEPCFDNVFEILDQKLMGQNQNHLKLILSLPESGLILEAVAFNIDKEQWPNHRAKQVHAAYRLDINFYQGKSKLQLMIEAMQVL